MEPGSTSMDARIQLMFAELENAPAEIRPSKYWQVLNAKNLEQLADTGYDNFKCTLARNYFTWVLSTKDPQIRFLRSKLPWWTVAIAGYLALTAPRHAPLTRSQTRRCHFLGRLLWEYALRQDHGGLLDRLEEPLEGNPPRLHRAGRLISQDLANSVLEFRAVAAAVDPGEVQSILELGAGYGRTAFVYLKAWPQARYIVADIPPALAICERYLSSQFPQHRVFRYRPFRAYDEVREEFEAAQIAFLLPQQLALLPDRGVDLFVNISSLHEMRIEQIRYYFSILQRLVRKYSYLKQWRESKIPYDDVVIREADYPIPAGWRQKYWRVCAVQEQFFEALHEVP